MKTTPLLTTSDRTERRRDDPLPFTWRLPHGLGRVIVVYDWQLTDMIGWLKQAR